MVIDLIIPTYKPRDKFQESLKRLALQTRKPDRIILVNTEAEFFDEEMITPYAVSYTHLTLPTNREV